MAALKSMNREELNAEAVRLGIAQPEELDKNADVIAAIEASDVYQAEQTEAEAKAPTSDVTPVYIVGGITVDPNGKQVTG